MTRRRLNLPRGCTDKAGQRRFGHRDPPDWPQTMRDIGLNLDAGTLSVVQGSECRLALCDAIGLTSLGGREGGGRADHDAVRERS